MTQDFKELLNIFNEKEVKYLIVGGYAVMKYSEPRFTKDLDIWIEASAENGKKVYSALKSFGAPLEGLTEQHFSESGFYQMGRPPIRVDILMTIEGVDFRSAWENREEADFDGTPVYFISLSDLIKNKKAVGRLQDFADIERLRLSAENRKVD
jgi:hypothetical protein